MLKRCHAGVKDQEEELCQCSVTTWLHRRNLSERDPDLTETKALLTWMFLIRCEERMRPPPALWMIYAAGLLCDL